MENIVRRTYDLVNAGVCAGNKHKETDDKDNEVAGSTLDVMLIIPIALLEKEEPHNGRDPEREARNEEGRTDSQKLGEKWDGLCDNPRKEDHKGNDGQPSDPALAGIDEPCNRVFVKSTVDKPASDRSVDRA